MVKPHPLQKNQRGEIYEIEKIDFTNQNQNIVILGDVATGKRQKTTRARIQHSDLIVIDELFYLTPSAENLVYLYKTIMFLAETRSFIFVTNRPLSQWENMDVDTHIVSTFRRRIMTDAQLVHLG